jgi:hypothetical protein
MFHVATFEDKEQMEELIASFNKATCLTYHNPTGFDLVVEGWAVYTRSYIPEHTIIGEIFGEQRYIWEMNHSDYVIVDQDYVLDTSTLPSPRSIVTMVREENATNNMANCTVVTCDGPRFFLQATKDILPDTELVYYVLGHMYI